MRFTILSKCVQAMNSTLLVELLGRSNSFITPVWYYTITQYGRRMTHTNQAGPAETFAKGRSTCRTGSV